MTGIFRAYDIRGNYPCELDAATARKIGSGFTRYLGAERIVVGRDMRPSSGELAAAFIDGAIAEGTVVSDAGMVSTPLLDYILIEGKFDGGAMVTASHLPADMNGFKLSRRDAVPLSGGDGLPELEREVRRQPASSPRHAPGSREDISMLDPYIRKIGSFAEDAGPLKLVVDAGNGMAGPEVTLLCRKFPAWSLIPLYFEPDERFPHHVPNPALPASTRDLQAKVIAECADLGVAFDGDVDRCGFVDERGTQVRADLVTALFAGYFLSREPGSTVLYDLRSSHIVPETISRKNGRGIRTRVGHAFIRPQMREESAIFGGEQSGHYYYRDMGFCDNGLLTMVIMINILAREKKPLSELIRPVDVYGSTGEINFTVKDFAAVEKVLVSRYSHAEIDRLDGLTVTFPDWWFNIRTSHTEPVVRLIIETGKKDRVEEKKNEVIAVIQDADPEMELH